MLEVLLGISFVLAAGYFYRVSKLHGPNSSVEKNIVHFDFEKNRHYTMKPKMHICPSSTRYLPKKLNF